MSRRFTLISVSVLALSMVSCSSEQSIRSANTMSSGASTPHTASTTTPATVHTTTASTVAPTVVTSSAAPTTAATVVPRGWTKVSTENITGHAFPPCCADTWHGVASPPLPASGAALATGDYWVNMQWSINPADPLQLDVFRFEQCNVLPVTACEDMGSPYPDEALGVDDSASVPLTVPLDDTVKVVLVGFRGSAVDPATNSNATVGNGTDLAELAAAVENGYANVLTARLAGGESREAIVADLSAHPSAGWGPGLDGSDFSLSFTFGDAPPLLFQAPFGYDDGTPGDPRGTDVLRLVSIGMADGLITIYVYAGYYS